MQEIMESKRIVRESSSEKFQVLDKVFLDEFNPKKIRNVDVGLSDVEL